MVFQSHRSEQKVTLLSSLTFIANILYFCLHFSQMVGVEYILLHAQEPILYIIRKQQRQSPAQGEQCSMNKGAALVWRFHFPKTFLCFYLPVIPLSDYYIIAGVVYQAPDLGTVISSRVVSICHVITEECSGIAHCEGCFHQYFVFSAFCCPWNPVCFRWGHVILPLSPFQRVLVAF